CLTLSPRLPACRCHQVFPSGRITPEAVELLELLVCNVTRYCPPSFPRTCGIPAVTLFLPSLLPPCPPLRRRIIYVSLQSALVRYAATGAKQRTRAPAAAAAALVLTRGDVEQAMKEVLPGELFKVSAFDWLWR